MSRKQRIEALRDAGFEDLAHVVEETQRLEAVALLLLLDVLCKHQQRKIAKEGKC